MSADRNRHSFMSDPNAIEAMFGKYEVIYQISIETDSYKGILKSDDKKDFWIGQTGPDFFRVFSQRAADHIFRDDRERMMENLKKYSIGICFLRINHYLQVKYKQVRIKRTKT